MRCKDSLMRSNFLSSLPLLLVSRSSSLLATTNSAVKSECLAARASSNKSVFQRCMHLHDRNQKDIMFPSVSEFLKETATPFATSFSSQSTTTATTASQPVSISLGNPAGDADSIIGAIALAYIDTIVSNQALCSIEKDSSTKTTSMMMTPIVSIPQEALTTQRPETRYLLQELAKIDLDDLIAIDFPHLPTNASVALVDHNALSIQNKPGWIVTSIFDHHLDEGQHMDSCSTPEKRKVAFDSKTSKALVASTCTLMVERFPLSDPFPPSLSILLLGVILLDSVNLSPKAGKVTPRDKAAVQALLDRTAWFELDLPKELLTKGEVDVKPDLSKLFDILQNQKFHPDFWNSLTLIQALKLDYKSFELAPSKTFGVASVLQPMEDFMEKHNWMTSMDYACSDFVDSSDFFVIMFFSFSNSAGEDTGPRRQLVLLAKNEKSVEELVDFLKQDNELRLKEVKRTRSDNMYMVSFQQGNPKASRKQVAPILIDYFKS